MIIGIDFDNTLVNYDKLFYKVALEKGLIPEDVSKTKKGVRDYLRKIGKEPLWTELQGYVYGPRILETEPFPGVLAFFKYCQQRGIKTYIISHKTRYPFLGKKYDLHHFAQKWLEKQGFYNPNEINLSRDKVFFELTKEKKINRIANLKCTIFIDDLPEVLNEKKFPSNISRVLFDPDNKHQDVGFFEHAKSWSEIIEKIKKINLHNYFISNRFKQDVTNLIKKIGIVSELNIVSIEGGRNNQIFCVNTGKGKKFLLKAYFQHPEDPRDRFGAEFSFFSFAWENGIRCLPKPYINDPKNKLGLYEFIEGHKINPNEINEDFINQALNFFTELNNHKDSPKAKLFPNASEACFSLKEHFACIERRLEKLKKIDSSSEINKKAISFVENELLKTWEEIIKNVKTLVQKYRINIDEKILADERCISPSDFGFHNAILNSEGKLFFIDFEYAGWDDPAKMVCDFFCQPEVPVPLDYYDYFVKVITEKTFGYEMFKKRVEILFPIYKIKWCCIMLNEFLPIDSQRRIFAQSDVDHEKQKIKQLNKAKEYLKNLKDINLII